MLFINPNRQKMQTMLKGICYNNFPKIKTLIPCDTQLNWCEFLRLLFLFHRNLSVDSWERIKGDATAYTEGGCVESILVRCASAYDFTLYWMGKWSCLFGEWMWKAGGKCLRTQCNRPINKRIRLRKSSFNDFASSWYNELIFEELFWGILCNLVAVVEFIQKSACVLF